MDRLSARLALALLLATVAACAARQPNEKGLLARREAKTAALADDVKELDCELEAPTGSHIPEYTCRHEEVAERERQAGQEMLQQVIQRASNEKSPLSP